MYLNKLLVSLKVVVWQSLKAVAVVSGEQLSLSFSVLTGNGSSFLRRSCCRFFKLIIKKTKMVKKLEMERRLA